MLCPGIKPTKSRSLVQHSTSWVNCPISQCLSRLATSLPLEFSSERRELFTPRSRWSSDEVARGRLLVPCHIYQTKDFFESLCFIRFPDFSKSILKHLQETCHYTNHVVFDVLLFEVWISDELLWLVFNIWLTLDSNSTWFLLFPGSKKVVSTVQHDNVTIRSQENILVISKQSLQVVNFSTKW